MAASSLAVAKALFRESADRVSSLTSRASRYRARGSVAPHVPLARPAGARAPVGIFSCSKSTNEVNYAAQKLSRQVMGSNNIDSCNRT